MSCHRCHVTDMHAAAYVVQTGTLRRCSGLVVKPMSQRDIQSAMPPRSWAVDRVLLLWVCAWPLYTTAPSQQNVVALLLCSNAATRPLTVCIHGADQRLPVAPCAVSWLPVANTTVPTPDAAEKPGFASKTTSMPLECSARRVWGDSLNANSNGLLL